MKKVGYGAEGEGARLKKQEGKSRREGKEKAMENRKIATERVNKG